MAAAVLVACPAQADPIRVASWNLNNLHYEFGKPLRSRAPARSKADFAILGEYRDRLDADVVALQEVNGPRAAARVFPKQDFELHFSGRYTSDVRSKNRTDRIYTGFAVRKGVFDSVERRDYEALGLPDGRGRSLRWGTELRVEREGKALALLAVHLKSGCAQGALVRSRSDACETLARQRDPLDEWIDARADEGVAFIVLGDFNRALDVFGDRDHLWQAIDDGDPRGLDLTRLPSGAESRCWLGTAKHHENPIDFMVFDDRAWRMVRPRSFEQVDYAREHQDLKRATPSDHCPIVVTLDL